MLGYVLFCILIGCLLLSVNYIILSTVSKWIRSFGVRWIVQRYRGNESQSDEDQETFLRNNGYELGDKIGRGTYADVKKAYSVNTGKEVAIKIVNKQESGTGKRDKFLKREIEILKWMNHKNVIRVYDLLEGKDQFFIIMELASKGDLLSLLQERRKLPEEEAKVMFKSIMEGVQHCHKKGVTHRDLKLENILLSEDFQPIVTDFGFARYIGIAKDQRKRSTTFCGSYSYVAPEILQGIPYDGMASDVWSLGVVLYTMVCGRFPFDDSDPKQLLQQTTSGRLEYPIAVRLTLSAQVKDLMSRMITPQVNERITLHEATDHPWFKITEHAMSADS
ncbi:Testis-specific serine/threonine-protein kinase 3 [Acropora cervicornis]|uniref:Testis-specific serine/threonine-protein kinase 3 n=1 Tax=Acropora cervicornis TaxID=6130 RepID=A0AAD9QND5_ACRCE|nr:Testis-specific serine/threonine-protein kinase 3 [Acropora cervicornis]